VREYAPHVVAALDLRANAAGGRGCGLIHSRGHLPRGGYCVQDGNEARRPAGPAGEASKFTDEFKAGATKLVLDENKTIAQVARDLD